MKLTLCPLNLKDKDIPEVELKRNVDYKQLLRDYANENKKSFSVFVYFTSDEDERLREEYKITSFLVCMDIWYIISDIIEILNPYYYKLNHQNIIESDELCINVFAFETWEEAFHYCTDLKEGQ